MRRNRLADGLLFLPAMAAVLVEALVLRPLGALLDRLQCVPALRRLQQRLAGLPPGVALPLFLVPEAASRAGWAVSAWLLMTGAVWQGFAVYVLTKLLAGVTALWVYRACEPALLRVAWFARLHAATLRMRRSMLPPNPRFAALRQRVRVSAFGWLRPG